MKEPEYTLKQAISLYSMANKAYWEHTNSGCEQCVSPFAEGAHCEEGHRLMLLHNKWIRRMRRVMQLENREITLPSLISERVRA